MNGLLLAFKQLFCFHKFVVEDGIIPTCIKCGERCYHGNIRIVRCWNGSKEYDYDKDRPEQFIIQCYHCDGLFFEVEHCDFTLSKYCKLSKMGSHKLSEVAEN